MMAEYKKLIELRTRDVAEARSVAMQNFKSNKNVIEPEYKRDDILMIDREVNTPPEHLFLGLGWDVDRDTKRKHYRRYYPDELENCTEIMGDRKSPFNSYDLKRG